MELLHYRFHLHDSATPQINSFTSSLHDHRSLFIIHFHLNYFLQLVRPRPELVPFDTYSSILLLPGHLFHHTGPASIRNLLSQFGVSGGLKEVLARQIFLTVLAVSCDPRNVGAGELSMGVDFCVSIPYNDFDQIDRALRELEEETEAARKQSLI